MPTEKHAIDKPEALDGTPGNTAPDFQTEFARLLDAAKPEVSGAIRSSSLDWDLTLDGLCRVGLLSFQALHDLVLLNVSTAAEYDANGNRTGNTRGMYLTVGAFGGNLRVLIEGADEDTFAHLGRGTRVRLSNPSVRVSVPQNGRAPAVYVSASAIELVD